MKGIRKRFFVKSEEINLKSNIESFMISLGV